MRKQLYMVVEHFKDAPAVYRRFRERGRMAPEGLVYLSSWVDEQFERCFQLMETHDRSLLDEWIAKWSDLTRFEVWPVMTSQEAAEKIRPLPLIKRKEVMKQTDWFDRKFDFSLQENTMPSLLERLEGAPLRLRKKLKTIHPFLYFRKTDGKWS